MNQKEKPAETTAKKMTEPKVNFLFEPNKTCDSQTVLHLLFSVSQPTVCVTCAGAGTAKPSKWKMIRRVKLLGMCAESPASGARFVSWRFDLTEPQLFEEVLDDDSDIN